MAKVTPHKAEKTKVIQAKTRPDTESGQIGAWWNANSKKDLAQNLMATDAYLREQNKHRKDQASIYARLYGNMSLMGMVGTTGPRMSGKSAPPNGPSDDERDFKLH